MGWLLATGSNLETRGSVGNGFMGRNLWSEFAEPDRDRVEGEMAEGGREGLREGCRWVERGPRRPGRRRGRS